MSEPKFALAVEIEINSNCNRACAYCPNSAHRRPNEGQMDRALYMEILDQLKALDFRGRISYHFYNEPLLSPQLDEFVALTREHLPRSHIDLYTNGTLLDGARLSRLLEQGVDKFLVTRHHGADLSSFEVARGLLKPEDQEKVQYQSYREIILTNRGGIFPAIGKNRPPLPKNLPCYVPDCLMVITVKGDVLPCYEDYFEKNSMGNLRERSLIDIWNSQKYRDFRNTLHQGRRSDHEVCKNCNNTSLLG